MSDDEKMCYCSSISEWVNAGVLESDAVLGYLHE